MTRTSPVAQQAFIELKAANRALLIAMAYERLSRDTLRKVEARVAECKRRVKALLDVVQPELPAAGVLDQADQTVLGEAREAVKPTARALEQEPSPVGPWLKQAIDTLPAVEP